MFIVLLRFSQNKAQAAAFMDAHNEWLRQGFADGAFLLAGSLQPGLGGALIAHGITRDALEARVNQDPFVAENIVSAEILDIDLKKADERLSFLLN